MMPLTKTTPKALLPLGNKPAIHWLVEECRSSGIKDIIIVVSAHSPVKDYFARNQWLYDQLKEKNDRRELRALHRLQEFGVRFVAQEPLLGEVHALSKALPLLRRAPFAVLFCDNLFLGPQPAVKEAIQLFRKHGRHVKSNGRYVFDYSIVSLLKSLDFKDACLDSERGIDFVQVFDRLREGVDYLERFAASKRYNIGDLHSYFEAFKVFADRHAQAQRPRPGARAK